MRLQACIFVSLRAAFLELFGDKVAVVALQCRRPGISSPIQIQKPSTGPSALSAGTEANGISAKFKNSLKRGNSYADVQQSHSPIIGIGLTKIAALSLYVFGVNPVPLPSHGQSTSPSPAEATMNDRLRMLQRQPRRITITLSFHVHEALLTRSEEEGRSVSNLCAYLLEDALRNPVRLPVAGVPVHQDLMGMALPQSQAAERKVRGNGHLGNGHFVGG
jgi:hypothetical protein